MINDMLLSILKEVRIFRGLSDDQLKEISNYTERISFSSNDIIIEEGQTGHPLHIILKGQVEVFLPKQKKGDFQERPTKIRLGQLDQGDCFGEYSLIDNEPASASIIAVGPCEVLQLSREDFRKILTSSDAIAKITYLNMLKVLTKRARESDKVLDMCF
jgi:CRP-like cAMP-binding protein